MLIVKQKELYFIACSVLMLNVIALGIVYINNILKEKVSFSCTCSSNVKSYSFIPALSGIICTL